MTDPTVVSAPDLDEGQLADYLDRIGVDPASLAELQLAHLLAVPFENLDIPLGRPIVLDPAAIHHKVVVERRGGYCYELNSQFARLLRTLGWEVSFLSARVARGPGVFGEEFDHLTLLVSDRTAAAPHLVDVGFGDAFTIPLPLIDGAGHDDRGKRVRLRCLGGDTWDYEEDRGNGWVPGYRFTTTGHELAAFAERNHWQQTSPDSNFTGRTVCTCLTPSGRLTLSDGRLIVTDHSASVGANRTEHPASPAETAALLQSRFGITLPAPLPGA